MIQGLKDKVVIVTGGGHGIGRAYCHGFAEAGAKVIVADIDAPAAEKVAGEVVKQFDGKALAAKVDVANEQSTKDMAKLTLDKFSRIDVLVNNAAVRREAPIDDIDLAAWREIMAVILDGAFVCVKACLAPLRASGKGAIVNIGGLSGHTGAAGRPHVVAAKAGIVGLTRALAHDLAPDSITVNCVAPGLIDTVRKASSSVAPAHAKDHKVLAGRKGSPAEVAAAVRFLAGPNARYVTGQTLHVNGGAYLG
jgi:3-oxoacyl-[acyl-carrier protein] reductase